MSFKDHPNSRGPSSNGASRPARPAGERTERRGDDRPRGGQSFGPRDDRGPRREGGFGGGDRPRFNSGERGPRPEGADRPRFNSDRGPRPER
ncbi:MAG: RNA helicase, partial [Comamonas sp.]